MRFGAAAAFRSANPAALADTTAPEFLSTEGVMAGDPCVAGTRTPLAVVESYMRDGAPEAELLAEYPTLPEDTPPPGDFARSIQRRRPYRSRRWPTCIRTYRWNGLETQTDRDGDASGRRRERRGLRRRLRHLRENLQEKKRQI